MRNEEGLMNFLKDHRPGEITTVPPVVAEIEYGIRRIDPSSKKHTLLLDQYEKLLAHIAVLPWDHQSSTNFGEIKAALEKAGTPIDDFDIAIGAIAKSHGATVITANLAHFKQIDGLISSNWA
jgi:tRNA(fMet)-specific endonuclease VapC